MAVPPGDADSAPDTTAAYLGHVAREVASPTQLQTTRVWTKKAALPPTRRNSETPAVTLTPRTEPEATAVSTENERLSTQLAEENLTETYQEV